MVQRLAALATELTAGDVCFVHVLDTERQRVVLSGATPPFDEHVGHIALDVGEGVAGWVAQHAQPAVIEDKWADPRYKYIPELRGEDYESLVSVPMVDRAGDVVGVLNVHSRAAGHFRPEDAGILADVANLMADAVVNARLHTRLAQREAELARFAEHTLELQEAERERIAAEIHDGISQRIVSLSYHLCAATDSRPPLPPAVLSQLGRAQALAGAALDEARVAINALRPPLLDDLGLGACLRGLAHELPEAIEREVVVDDHGCRLDSHVETAVYRMAQEILQNVVKHAAASRVRLTLEGGDGWGTLTIADDGVGFATGAAEAPAGRPAHGLAGLRARAALVGAELTITTAPGQGTAVRVAVPRRRHGDAEAG